MSKTDELDRYHPKDRADWRKWLEKNHEKSLGVWFVYYKKASGKPRVSYDDAVEEALCFGWIDSLPRKFDESRSMLLFTPRKPKSVWSKLNKGRVEKLIKQGLVADAGLRKIEAAKQDGSWNKLDEVEELKIPADLSKAFEGNKIAEERFNRFSNSVKKGILGWIASAKRPETRAKRIEKTIAMAAKNRRAMYDSE
ncbi:MAG: YdeI/OmpD-associated family protein [Pyrinomonadaceae bacterium]|jgi:uncharacterized protein YdeI (YjbR/CyaY-like superfamily)|nr:YdeI/OmpD-associated family protein [Pyrinomonadaceae bacterium]